MIADPSELEAKQEHLLWKDQTVGHVYNRLVDFFFEETVNATIREAYVKGFGTARLGVLSVVVVSGLTSIGSMAITNFVIGFDFKWLLFTFTLPWAAALLLALPRTWRKAP